MEKPVKGQVYYLKYKHSSIVRRDRGGNPSEWSLREEYGNYDYINNVRGKLHFFSNERGLDIYITLEEFNRIKK